MKQTNDKLAKKTNDWINSHPPDGLLKLSQKADVSMTTVHYARHGVEPRKETTKQKLFKTLRYTEEK